MALLTKNHELCHLCFILYMMVYKNIKKFFINLGNELRDDFQFFHTFEREAREHYNLEAGSIIIFHSEWFHTKYEDKYKVFHKVTTL